MHSGQCYKCTDFLLLFFKSYAFAALLFRNGTYGFHPETYAVQFIYIKSPSVIVLNQTANPSLSLNKN